MAQDIEDRLVFALSTIAGHPFLMLGLSARARERLAAGNTHTLDLAPLGVPLKLMLYGGKDHADCMTQIEAAARRAGVALLDERRRDFSIKPKGDGAA